jgi:predicted nucleic acid-binding protein
LLIAQTAVYYDLYLLHNDHDFDIVAEHITELKILETL